MDNSAHLLKPYKLHFRRTPDLSWSYFYLETEEIDYSGVYGELNTVEEELVELPTGKYIKRGYWDQGEYNGEPLPEDSRLIGRFKSGNFVIFSKASIYNRRSSTYDGRHDKMGFQKFEEYINQSVTRLIEKSTNNPL